MSRLRIIGIIILSSMLLACEGDTFYLIPDNQHPSFEEGDRLIYQSNYGRKDTFKVIQVTHNFENSTPKPNSKYSNFYEFIHYEIVRYKNNVIDSSFKNELDFYYGGEVMISWDKSFQHVTNYDKSLDSMLVSEETFYDIYEISLMQGEGNINKMYCNNQYGVLRYEYPYQVYWEFVGVYNNDIDEFDKSLSGN